MSKLLTILAAAAFVLASTPTQAQVAKRATEAAAKAKAEAEKKGKSAPDKKRKARAVVDKVRAAVKKDAK